MEHSLGSLTRFVKEAAKKVFRTRNDAIANVIHNTIRNITKKDGDYEDIADFEEDLKLGVECYLVTAITTKLEEKNYQCTNSDRNELFQMLYKIYHDKITDISQFNRSNFVDNKPTINYTAHNVLRTKILSTAKALNKESRTKIDTNSLNQLILHNPNWKADTILIIRPSVFCDEAKKYGIERHLANKLLHTIQSHYKREAWITGSECKIYSKWKKKWFDGTITNITRDDEGEWLEIKYKAGNQRRTKQIQRHSPQIQPISTISVLSAPASTINHAHDAFRTKTLSIVKMLNKNTKKKIDNDSVNKLLLHNTDWKADTILSIRSSVFCDEAKQYGIKRPLARKLLHKIQSRYKRETWIIGSECKIYSKWKKGWFDGTITDISRDNEGEWLEIRYKAGNQSRTKQVQRYSTQIQPILIVPVLSPRASLMGDTHHVLSYEEEEEMKSATTHKITTKPRVISRTREMDDEPMMLNEEVEDDDSGETKKVSTRFVGGSSSRITTIDEDKETLSELNERNQREAWKVDDIIEVYIEGKWIAATITDIGGSRGGSRRVNSIDEDKDTLINDELLISASNERNQREAWNVDDIIEVYAEKWIGATITGDKDDILQLKQLEDDTQIEIHRMDESIRPLQRSSVAHNTKNPLLEKVGQAIDFINHQIDLSHKFLYDAHDALKTQIASTANTLNKETKNTMDTDSVDRLSLHKHDWKSDTLLNVQSLTKFVKDAARKVFGSANIANIIYNTIHDIITKKDYANVSDLDDDLMIGVESYIVSAITLQLETNSILWTYSDRNELFKMLHKIYHNKITDISQFTRTKNQWQNYISDPFKANVISIAKQLNKNTEYDIDAENVKTLLFAHLEWNTNSILYITADIFCQEAKKYGIHHHSSKELLHKIQTGYQREAWTKGSRCKIYSQSSAQWCDGIITNIIEDEESELGEILIVKSTNQNGSISKEIQRQNEQIKPVAIGEMHLGQMNWSKIIECIKHEMWPKLASIIKAILNDKSNEIANYDLKPLNIDKVVNKLQEKRISSEPIDYFRRLIQRALYFSIKPQQFVKVNDNQKENNENDFDEKQPGLNEELLNDIWSTFKCWKFTEFSLCEYQLHQFKNEIVNRAQSFLGQAFTERWIKDIKIRDECHLYPQYLIDDDIFETFKYHFAISKYVDYLKKNMYIEADHPFNLKVFIIPQSVSSVYDLHNVFKYNITEIDKYLVDKKMYGFSYFSVLRFNRSKTFDISDIFNELQHHLRVEELELLDADHMCFIVDRRRDHCDFMYILLSAENRKFIELYRNYFVSFSYNIKRQKKGNSVIAHLMYGIGCKMRFFPEILTTFIPRLFRKSSDVLMVNYLNNIYSDEFKHNWCVNLNDTVFNKYFKLFCGVSHVSVNYNRISLADEFEESPLLHFRELMEHEIESRHMYEINTYLEEHEYDTDSILMDITNDSNLKQHLDRIGKQQQLLIIHKLTTSYQEPAESDKICGKHTVKSLTYCGFLQKIVTELKEYKDSEQSMEISLFQLESLRHHIISVHGYLGETHDEVVKFIMHKVGECTVAHCDILHKHIMRRREREQVDDNEIDDTIEGTDNDEAQEEEQNILDEILRARLNALHTHCLHKKKELYRLKRKTKQDHFVTMMTHKDNKSMNKINFGVSVLEWFDFGEEPQEKPLRIAMITNPESTVTHQLYLTYSSECYLRLLSDTFKSHQWLLDELIAVKYYTDTNTYCAGLRKAHWSSATNEQREHYYQWALVLYRTSLFHAAPIRRATLHSKSPLPLYHGINRVFVIDDAFPRYNGPTSTSIEQSVGHQFTDGVGMYWVITPSYSNPFKRVVGIHVNNITQYDNEKEIILLDQYFPISCTQNFEVDIKNNVDHLMFSLKDYQKFIINIDTFYNILGFVLTEPMINIIKNHDILYDSVDILGSTTSRTTILSRLVKELGVKDEVLVDREQITSITSVKCVQYELFNHLEIRLNVDTDNEHKEDVLLSSHYKMAPKIVGNPIYFQLEVESVFFSKDCLLEGYEYDVFIRNADIFGKDVYVLFDTIQIPAFNNQFYDALNQDDSGSIQLDNIHDIKPLDRKQIINAHYTLIKDDHKSKITVNDVKKQKYVTHKFDRIQDIYFKMSSADNMCLYIQIKANHDFFRFKIFKISEKTADIKDVIDSPQLYPLYCAKNDDGIHNYRSVMMKYIHYTKLNKKLIIDQWKLNYPRYPQEWLLSIRRDEFLDVAINIFKFKNVQIAVAFYQQLIHLIRYDDVTHEGVITLIGDEDKNIFKDIVFLWTRKNTDTVEAANNAGHSDRRSHAPTLEQIKLLLCRPDADEKEDKKQLISLDHLHFLYIVSVILEDWKSKKEFSEVDMKSILRCLHRIQMDGFLFSTINKHVFVHTVSVYSHLLQEVNIKPVSQMKTCAEQLYDEIKAFNLESITPENICNISLSTHHQNDHTHDIFNTFKQWMVTFKSQYNRSTSFSLGIFKPLIDQYELDRKVIINMKYDNYSTDLGEKTYDDVLKSFIAWSITLKCDNLRCEEKLKLNCYCDTNTFQLYTYKAIMGLIELKANNNFLLLEQLRDINSKTTVPELCDTFCEETLPKHLIINSEYIKIYKEFICDWINFDFYNFQCIYCHYINKTIMIGRLYHRSKNMDSCRICNKKQMSRVQNNQPQFNLKKAIENKTNMKNKNVLYERIKIKIPDIYQCYING